MQEERLERAARLLADARKTGRKLAALPADSRPTTVAEALAVQEVALRLNHARPGGWKAGGPTGAATTCAPMYAADLYASPASISVAAYPGLKVEGEIAFHLHSALPASGRPYRDEQVSDAVSLMCAALEIGVSRYQDFEAVSILEKIADNLGNGGFVHGGGTDQWRKLDPKRLHVTMEVNGKSCVDKIGDKPGGEPFALLVWAANHANGDAGLAAGDFVTTGSWTGLYAAQRGDEIRVKFDGVGEVSLRCD